MTQYYLLTEDEMDRARELLDHALEWDRELFDTRGATDEVRDILKAARVLDSAIPAITLTLDPDLLPDGVSPEGVIPAIEVGWDERWINKE